MNKKLLSLTLLLSALWSSNQALAIGEVLKLETYGTKYCTGQAPIELDPTNAQTFWAQVDSATQLSVYLDAALTKKAFVMPTKLTSLPDDPKGRAVYAVDAIFGPVSTGYIAFNGVVKSNRTKTLLNTVKVNFIRRGLIDTCSASGFMIGKRVL
ncbi:MAG: hypothetical protein PHH59_15810 [Methylovulum sp.]|uniref:hypothetical protein n=1 Tax=Methylovulum sp. TaxID=1916980 RepID=UPI002632C3A8|nr:hypothetical protein [Methylovulum sp.]MDD2725472.1 hypothetical protein [Methylovulum sp.]MDD5126220.1 hypothetical protein [Methylovulum sp.]